MRSLTVVKDEVGNVKIAQFGSVWDADFPNALDEHFNYFKNWVETPSNLELLKKKINLISFFSADERVKFNRKLEEDNNKTINYSNDFLDAEIGVHILDKASTFTSKTRLENYYKYIEDTMFASVIFEINFQKGIAQMRVNGIPQYTHKFAEEKENKVVEVKHRRGRPRKTEAEEYAVSIMKANKRIKGKRGRPRKKW